MVNLHEVIAKGRAAGMDSEVVLYALSKVWDADEGTFEKVFRLAKGLSDEKRNRLLPMVVNYLQSHLTHSKRISYETIVQIEEQTLPKRKRSMLSYFDEIKNESLEQGLEQGMEQGLKKGVKEGEKKASEKIAENLIRDGMEISRICQHTGMSRKQVEQIQNNLQRH
jgi:predicted transposase/invertase (TIGR01784 family)